MDLRKITFGLIFLVLFLIIVSWFVVSTSKNLNLENPTENITLSGTLYFSLVPKTGLMPFGIYSYNFDSKKTISIIADKNKSSKYSHNFSPSLSDDGLLMAFTRRISTEEVLQIYTSTPDGKNIKQITSSPDRYKREPVFSPSKEFIAYVVFETAEKGKATVEIPDNWSIHIINISKKEDIKIATGVNPIFSLDETKLIILKNDGLHLLDIKDKKKIKDLGVVLKPYAGRASQTMKITVSRDRTKIAMSSPVSQNSKGINVLVGEINSWEKFSITPSMIIPIKAYYSVFSPDGRYLAVLERKKISLNDKEEYTSIVAYDLLNTDQKPFNVLDLKEFDNGYMWLGSWAK